MEIEPIQRQGRPAATHPNRLLHTMLRVRDLAASIEFYTESLGMSLLRREDHPEGDFSLAYVGYGPEAATTVLELTHNWDGREYVQGTSYGHIALAVADIYASCARLAGRGVRVPRPPGPRSGSEEVIAFIEDPDGYKIELINVPARGGD
jgi:lactoylglutathione lyase